MSVKSVYHSFSTMPYLTRKQRIDRQVDKHELESLKQQVNIAIIKGLRSITKNVSCTAKISISREMYAYLQQTYALKFKSQSNEQFVADLRVIRANFRNKSDYSKAECLEFALRQSRDVVYKSFKEGRLQSILLSPLPYLSIKYFRNDKKLRK